MTETDEEPIDSQFFVDNVEFLDNCFDNSFTLQNSLIAIKQYVAEEQESTNFKTNDLTQKKINTTRHNKTGSLDSTSSNLKWNLLSQSLKNEIRVNRNLKEWGLPYEIAKKYEEKGISDMFDWQVTCLSNAKVLMDCCSLVYSAPTSAGKTLVAEILSIKTVLERQKKVIIILPFVSIVREKMFYLQDILSSSGIRVEGFMGSKSPPGGLQAVHVAICTIEKANSLINKLLDDNSISDLGAVVVDELHLLGDSHRGYILELLLTKIKYVSLKLDDCHIQIVGMSATLPNLEILAKWLDAELFITQFRPIPLDEYCLIGSKYYDKHGNCVNAVDNGKPINSENDNVLNICLGTIKDGCSVLIFCMTKNRCECLAQSISSSFFKLGCSGDQSGLMLRKQLNSEKILEVLEQLKNSPVGLDQILKSTISFGVAYHHAGLTFDERDIVEGGFKSGAIRVLVATSTLSSGVNLPARKVIIRTPVFRRQSINILTYKQMIGRAGRMGIDTKGESVLICTEAEKKVGFDLMMGTLDPVTSCIENEDKFMRAVLEMIASEMACTKTELDLYSKNTLLYTQKNIALSQSTLLEDTLKELKNYELVRVQSCEEEEEKYVATPLGKACLSASMAPNDGLSLFCELQRARQCLVLETDLHLIYLVTPYSVSSQWGDIDWLHLLTLWESLPKAMKRVGELVGVHESFIIRCLRGTNKLGNADNKLNIHKRFYTALALQDLVNEVPLSDVSAKFQCARGFLQGLQQSAATFAGMVTTFCHQLGWKNMELLISQFQDRLHFGIHSELLELMKIPSLNGTRARTLFDAGFETISNIASADVNAIENALYKSVPFQSEKGRDDEDPSDVRQRNKVKNIWVTGHCGLTTKKAAENLILEARKYLEYEIGVSEIKWTTKDRVTLSQYTYSDNNIAKSTKDKPLNNSGLPVVQHFKKETLTQETKQNVTASCISEKNCMGNRVDNLTKTVIGDNKESFGENAGVTFLNNTLNGTCTRKKNVHITSEVFGIIKEEEKAIEKHVETNSHTLNDCKNFAENVCAGFISNTSRKSDYAPVNVKHEVLQTDNESSPSILKDDHIWDTLNFTEKALDNIVKDDNSHKLNKPYICYTKHDIPRFIQKDSFIEDSSHKAFEINIENNKHILYDCKSPVNKKVIDKSFYDGIIENASGNINLMPSHEVDQTNEDSNHLKLKDDVIWDTLNLTEVPSDIIKDCNSDKVNKLTSSYDTMNSCRYFTDYADSKSVSVKDISLFSSEGDNSSLFEESMPLDSIPSNISNEKSIQNKIFQHIDQNTINTNFNNLDSTFESIQATTLELNEDEDIKLVYDDENKETDSQIVSDASEDIKVLSTLGLSVAHTKSPFKRPAERNNDPPLAKKSKIAGLSTLNLKTTVEEVHIKPIVEIKSVKSKSFQLQIDRNHIICYVLTENDILDNLHVLEKLNEVSIYLNVKNNMSKNEVIGRNIIKTPAYKHYTNSEISSINGITLYTGHSTCFYLDLTTLNDKSCLAKCKLSKWFEKKSLKVSTISLKMNFMSIKHYFEVDLPADCLDISLADWLLDADERIPDVIYLIRKYCGIDLATVSLKINNTVKRFTTLDKISTYFIKAWSIYKISEEQQKLLIESYQNVQIIMNTEIQVLKILATCEYFGICVDKELAAQFLIDVRSSQEILQKKAYKICGYHFNFNSSKEVAKVLGMYKRRKVSTKKSVLSLCNSPISNIIMYWRKLSSILTNTLYPLTEKAFSNRNVDRINPTYNLYTCTGRVSMHEPNLQNVPRTFSIPAQYLTVSENPEISTGDVIEFNCRNIFRATTGNVLISADYCQLEMRILTHYSEDIVLTKIMKSDMDVFKSIAASWADVTEDEVDDDLRQKAKQLCYGILYGMGNKTLSQHLEVSEMEAAIFMDSFYKTYPAIRVLTQKIIEKCRRNGYVETLMKRRRYLPDINSSVVSKKNAAERQAINTTIQGSAADIAKAAMCAIDNRASGENKPRLILQMHDELIYEVPESQKDSFLNVIKEVMESTVILKVPLPVKVRFGHTWGTLNEVKI